MYIGDRSLDIFRHNIKFKPERRSWSRVGVRRVYWRNSSEAIQSKMIWRKLDCKIKVHAAQNRRNSAELVNQNNQQKMTIAFNVASVFISDITVDCL